MSSKPPIKNGQLFKIAEISAPHGIRGELKLICFLENCADLARYNPLRTASGNVYEAQISGYIKNQIIVKLSGVTDRNQADNLRGIELYAAVDKLPKLCENEFYHNDLIGLKATLENGREIGKIAAIHNFGAGDILEITTSDDTADDELLLPFQSPFVGDINSERIIITLPQYLENSATENSEIEKFKTEKSKQQNKTTRKNKP